MVRGENMPWCWLLLGILNDSGGMATLQDIYASIEEELTKSEKADPKIINARLFEKDPRYGDRPRYQHTVRGCLAAYRKQSLMERIDRGVYRITDAGLNRLKWYNEYY